MAGHGADAVLEWPMVLHGAGNCWNNYQQ